MASLRSVAMSLYSKTIFLILEKRIREIEKQIHKLIEYKDYEGLVLLLKGEEESQ